MDPVALLFGSLARLKLTRLFLFNEDQFFTASEAAYRTRTEKSVVRREIAKLMKIKILRKRNSHPTASYSANKNFVHHESLITFLRETTGLGDREIVKALRRIGNVRLIVLSGILTGSLEAKVDLLIVGDRLDDRKLSPIVHTLESEIGSELRFASFSTEDFKYRLGVYDRLVRDIFDFPHRTILDRIGVHEQYPQTF